MFASNKAVSTAGIRHPKWAMQFTVGKHIEQFERHRKKLNADLMDSNLSRAQRNRLEAEIRWVDVVLDHCRDALAAEKKILERRL